MAAPLSSHPGHRDHELTFPIRPFLEFRTLRIHRFLLSLSLAAVALAAPPVSAQELQPEFHAWLVQVIGLAPGEVRGFRAGEPVANVLASREARDIAVFGMVNVHAPLSAVRTFLSTYPAALVTPGRTFGFLHEPIAPGEFDGVSVTDANARALRECREGSCPFKLSAQDMKNAASIIQRDDDAKDATLFVQERLASIAIAYRQKGNAGMPEYNDAGKRTVPGADAFAALVAENPMFHFAPGLQEFLTGYPRTELAGSREVLYWAVDDNPGIKATTTLNHRMVFSPHDSVVVAATKLVTADHYLEAGLDVIVAIEKPESNGAETTIMFLRQYRFDQMPKVFFVSLRGRVSSKLRERALADLQRLRVEIAK